ncbi:hypothetical protein Ae201684_016018 [Aphanomyces euteiches]|uniref:Uncharacterized protein n=1 Tax=Aphanomyces euteiches TaxID=100861 RepID=A0A6G0WDW8_9STRA|nr:hypothetical protein Ae201684_016018 [Aphanomyces euteiches]KAH9141240.1 hypothetical protein AeRB84_014557 [Aphanomyces euteiches]
MTLAYEIPQDQAIDNMVRMPASLFFSYEQRAYIADFLASNATSRNQMQPWQICQHNLVLSLEIGESCIWLEEIGSNRYVFWVAVALIAYPATRWIKVTCIFRCFLTLYVIFVLWTRYYYRHYVVLLSNLRQFGLSQKYVRYRVVVGAPVYAVLSDPIVSLAFMIDLGSTLSYFALAHLQVTQYRDFWVYASGCVYMSRTVWYAFLVMRVASIVVKKIQWESNFGPVDPGLLAVCAMLYSGPIVSLVGSTHLQIFVHELLSLPLPYEHRDQAIECFPAASMFIFAMAFLPLVFSRFSLDFLVLVANRVYPAKLSNLFVSDYKYNDVKAYILLMLTMEKHAKYETGGSLHELFRKNPLLNTEKYRSLAVVLRIALSCVTLLMVY